MAVHEEIWTGEVLKKFRRDSSFLETIPDRSALVGNKAIHLVDLGADPEVFINNTTYPIPTIDAGDADIIIALDKYDTGNTAIKDDHLYAISYDIIAENTEAHVRTLSEKSGDKAIHALAPNGHTAATPVIATTGSTDGGVNARKKITKSDVLRLKKAFDDANIPRKDRVLVLCPDHIQQILEFDEQFAAQYQNIRDGIVLPLYGFAVYEYSLMPTYNASNVKKAFGAAAAPTTDCYASVAFYAPRMFKAMSMPEMYYRTAKESPETRATTIGFRHYFMCMPKKSDAIGAIVSVATA